MLRMNPSWGAMLFLGTQVRVQLGISGTVDRKEQAALALSDVL